MSVRRSISAAAAWAGVDVGQAVPVVASGLGEGVMAARMAAPARVRLGPGRIEYIPLDAENGAGHWWPAGKPARNVFLRFIKLVDASDEVIAAFARDFGVLGLTPQGLPSTSPSARRVVPQLAEPWCGCAVSWEPIEAWRLYAMGAKAVTHLALELREARDKIDPNRVLAGVGLIRDREAGHHHLHAAVAPWEAETASAADDLVQERRLSPYLQLGMLMPETIAFNLDRQTASGARHSLSYQRRWLASYVTRYWLAHAALTPAVYWDDKAPFLSLPIGQADDDWDHPVHPRNALFNILAAQLAGLLCAGVPYVPCENCGRSCLKRRNTRYCPECQETAAGRRQQRWREKRKQMRTAVPASS